MSVLKKNYYRRREDDMKILIATAKTRNNLTNEGLAKRIGMPANTFNKKHVTLDCLDARSYGYLKNWQERRTYEVL